MGFGEDVARWAEKATRQDQAVFERSVDLVKESIVAGSAVTGAPGQPIGADGGAELRNSWTSTIQGDVGTVSTDADHAPTVEAGARLGRALTLRSPVGGFHSVKLTRAGWPRLVEQAVKEVVGGNA